MSKRKSIVSDGFGDWLTGESTTPSADSIPVSPARQTPPPAAQSSANQAIQLSGQSRAFTAHIDTGLLLELDVVKTELRRLTNMNAHDTSKRLILEAALRNLIDDFYANKEASYLFNYIANK
jgi:hypothetical protein